MMTSRIAPLVVALLLVLGGVAAFAQTPAARTGNAVHPQWVQQQEDSDGLSYLASQLNLTDSQTSQIRSIFETAHQKAVSIKEQLPPLRLKLEQAIKTNNQVEIQNVSTQISANEANLRTVVAGAMAQAYSLLTPDQKVKADQLVERIKNHMRQGDQGDQQEEQAPSVYQ